MTEIEQLQIPLTPLETATILSACAKDLTPAGTMLLRRLAFERDQLLEWKAEEQKFLISATSRILSAGATKDKLLDCIIQIIENLNRLKADNKLHRSKSENEYWVWQTNEEENHLESLICPILISAAELRKIINERNMAEKQLKLLGVSSKKQIICEHEYHKTNYGEARCCKCNLVADNWYCEASPTRLCQYDEHSDECVFCSQPSERK